MAAVQVTKINKLKNFGSFANFAWPTALVEFKKHNLLYGKNGSGKTTLSQFFQSYEEGSFPAEFTPSPTAEISTNQGVFSDFSVLNKKIRVFNVYYIQKNLFWENGQATKLLWLGKADIKIQETIATLANEIKQLETSVGNLDKDAKLAEVNLQNFLRDNSKAIRIFLGYQQTKYQSPQLQKDYANLANGQLAGSILSEEELTSQRVMACSTSAASQLIPYSVPSIGIKLQSTEVTKLLTEKIIPTIQLQDLIASPALKKWVNEGLHHHTDAGECKFCKGELSEKRLLELKGFFDDAQKLFSSRLEVKKTELERVKLQIINSKPETSGIAPELITKNTEVEMCFTQQKEAIISLMDMLLSAINEKADNLYADAIQTQKNLEKIDWDKAEQEYILAIAEINKIRELHNEKIKSFDSAKSEAQRNIELHFALEQKDKFLELRKLVDASKEAVAKNANLILQKTNEFVPLNEQISSSSEAAKKISLMLKQMGHGHITLEYNDVKKAYVLKRGGVAAKRLSEGEKTAIAFAHFIAALQESEFILSESVVVIDDPISSLDGTSTYFISGLVKSLKASVGQLFVMTHNHSFFVHLIKNFRNKKQDEHYEVRRIMDSNSDVGYSEIIEMEEKKIIYYSEYNHLFSNIYQAHTDISSGKKLSFDELYTLMNCSRKLIEGFLGFKYPDEYKLEKRWERAVQDNNIDPALELACFRVINFGSHSGIDAFLAGSGLETSEMAECINLVLNFIKIVDSKHFDGMVKCAGGSTGVPTVAEEIAE